jgi:hypothetical protein
VNSLYSFSVPSSLTDADALGHRLAARVQADSGPLTGFLFTAQSIIDQPIVAYLACAAAIKLTGEPQLLALLGPGVGHAVVAYKVDGAGIHIADPNYPGQDSCIQRDGASSALGPYHGYNHYLVLGKTSLAEWDKLPGRFDEFYARTVGQRDFPTFTAVAAEVLGKGASQGTFDCGSVSTDVPNETPIRVHSTSAKIKVSSYVNDYVVSCVNTDGSPVGVIETFSPDTFDLTLQPGVQRIGVDVSSQDLNGNFENWAGFTWLTLNAALDPPVALPATDPITNGFTANWQVVEGAESYLVDVSRDPSFATFIEHDFEVTNTTARFAGTSFTTVTNYYYRVRAHSEGLTSTNSGTITVVPAGFAYTHTNFYASATLSHYQVPGFWIPWSIDPPSPDDPNYINSQDTNGQPASVSSSAGSAQSSGSLTVSSAGFEATGQISSAATMLLDASQTDVLKTDMYQSFELDVQFDQVYIVNLSFTGTYSFGENPGNAGGRYYAGFGYDGEGVQVNPADGLFQTSYTVVLPPGNHSLSGRLSTTRISATIPGRGNLPPVAVDDSLSYQMAVTFTPLLSNMPAYPSRSR